LFTPQRLFGETAFSPEILAHEPFLERARLQREQERDGLARLALGAYVVARLVDKVLLVEHDRDLIDGFRWQLEAVRRHVDDLPAEAPESAHLAGIVSAVPESGHPTSALWMSLSAYAYFLEHEGRLEEALEILTLAARSQGENTAPADFVGYALLAGRLNRLLARWDVASHCYEKAREAADTLGDRTRALRARLGEAHVLRGCGNLPRARTEVERVIREAADLRLADVQGDAHQDLGVVLMVQGLRDESLKATYEAFRLAEDPVTRMRILGDLGYGLRESGHYEAARVALEIVAASNSSVLIKLNALLELMQVESAVGNRVAFERKRGEIRELGDRMTPSMAVDFRYKTAIGLARFGQTERVGSILAEALALAETHGLNEWYFRLERLEQGMRNGPSFEADIKAPAEVTATPAVHQMTAGLREYAALVTV
jgi:tetratricopeptide (TPR) repeat protein